MEVADLLDELVESKFAQAKQVSRTKNPFLLSSKIYLQDKRGYNHFLKDWVEIPCEEMNSGMNNYPLHDGRKENNYFNIY